MIGFWTQLPEFYRCQYLPYTTLHNETRITSSINTSTSRQKSFLSLTSLMYASKNNFTGTILGSHCWPKSLAIHWSRSSVKFTYWSTDKMFLDDPNSDAAVRNLTPNRTGSMRDYLSRGRELSATVHTSRGVRILEAYLRWGEYTAPVR